MAWINKTGAINEGLGSVWGPNSNDLWAGGTSSMWHWNGTAWTSFPAGGLGTFFGVHGFGSSDVWAVNELAGPGDKIWHWDGVSWTASLNDTTEFLTIWGSVSNDVWACGIAGAMWHWDGFTWTSVASGTGEDLYAIWGITGNDVWAVGSNGTTIHWDGFTWSVYANGLGLTSIFKSIHGLATDNIILVGDGGVIATWDGFLWTQTITRFTQDFLGVYAQSATDIWIVGVFEFWLHLDQMTSEPQPVSEDSGYARTWIGSGRAGVIAFDVNDAWAISGSIQAFKWTGPGPNSVAPVITNINPAPGTAIQSAQIISFDIEDDLNLFRRIIIIADMANAELREVIHDGNSFGPKYLESVNSRSAITNGFHYTVRRQNGWPVSPTIIPYAIDTSGNENA